MSRDRTSHWKEVATAVHYARAAVKVGLGAGEKKLLQAYFPPSTKILEVGCGAGRVARGLLALGYPQVLATDFSPVMVNFAREVLGELNPAWANLVQQEDVTQLSFPDASFEGVIYAFNGLMCLPDQAHRTRALREIYRVLQPGGVFFCSAADREQGPFATQWSAVTPAEDEVMGDSWHDTPSSPVFMHSSTEAETRAELEAAGFKVLTSPLSSDVAVENQFMKDFAGVMRFYIASKII